MKEPCNHENWRYCRRVFSNKTAHFGVQCIDCLDCIKLERHGNRLWLKPDDIPPDALIHAYVERGALL